MGDRPADVPAAAASRNFLSTLALDKTSMETIPEQIRTAMRAHMARCIDLFRQCDDDASGEISRPEFIRALEVLGLDAPREALGAVFDCFDLDNSGSIEYEELAQLIQRSKKISPNWKDPTLGEAERPRPIRIPVVEVSSIRRPRISPRYELRLRPPAHPADPYLPVRIGSSRWLPSGEVLMAWEHVSSSFPGRHRGSSKLAIVTYSSAHVGCSDGGLPIRTLKSPLLLTHLTDVGFSLLVFEAHTHDATWDDAGEAATARLLAALDYVASHRVFRYSRLALFAQGAGATAAFVALDRAPGAFAHRVKALCICEPAQGEERLAEYAATCHLPTLTAQVHTPEDGASRRCLPLSVAVHAAVPAPKVLQRLFPEGSNTPFDAIAHYSREPHELLAFLHDHIGEFYDPLALCGTSPCASPRSGTMTRGGFLSPRSPRKLPPIPR